MIRFTKKKKKRRKRKNLNGGGAVEREVDKGKEKRLRNEARMEEMARH